jgi:hypothetical protein
METKLDVSMPVEVLREVTNKHSSTLLEAWATLPD